MFALAIGLILAWRVAGYYGVDRYLLPRLGVPWHAKVVTLDRDADTTAHRPTWPVAPKGTA
jgi:thiosulfate dehydrogenase (quinone) large subunit